MRIIHTAINKYDIIKDKLFENVDETKEKK